MLAELPADQAGDDTEFIGRRHEQEPAWLAELGTLAQEEP